MKSSKLQLTNWRQTIKKSEKKAIKGHLVNLFNRILDTGKYQLLFGVLALSYLFTKRMIDPKSKITEVSLCFLR